MDFTLGLIQNFLNTDIGFKLQPVYKIYFVLIGWNMRRMI